DDALILMAWCGCLRADRIFGVCLLGQIQVNFLAELIGKKQTVGTSYSPTEIAEGHRDEQKTLPSEQSACFRQATRRCRKGSQRVILWSLTADLGSGGDRTKHSSENPAVNWIKRIPVNQTG